MGGRGLRGIGGNPAAPPFSNGPYTMDQHVTFTAGLSGANTPGKIFYVDPRGDEYGYGNDANNGESWSTPLATIQAAVDKCVTKRGDIIYVGAAAEDKNTTYFTGTTEYPDYRKIKENVLIFDKANIHIIAVPYRSGWSHQIRPSDGQGAYLDGSLAGSRTKYACNMSDSGITGAPNCAGVGFVVMSRDVEIAGFTIDCGGANLGIYIGDGSRMTLTGDALGEEGANASGAYIHDNYFVGDGSGTTGGGIALQGCGSDVLIESNLFDKLDGCGIFAFSGSGKTCERPTMRGNHFKNCKNYGVYVYNSATNIQFLIHGNTFQDGSNTMTGAVVFGGDSPVDALISGNYFGCTTAISGGASSWASGNFRNNAGNSAVYVDED